MVLGRFYGIIAIIMGGFVSGLGYKMLTETGSVLKFFLIGPPFFLLGIALLFCPGYPVTLQQSKKKEVAPDTFYRKAPAAHKITWAIAGVIGFVMSIYALKP